MPVEVCSQPGLGTLKGQGHSQGSAGGGWGDTGAPHGAPGHWSAASLTGWLRGTVALGFRRP